MPLRQVDGNRTQKRAGKHGIVEGFPEGDSGPDQGGKQIHLPVTDFPSKGSKVKVSKLQAELAKEKKVSRECCERAKEIMERLNDQYPSAATKDRMTESALTEAVHESQQGSSGVARPPEENIARPWKANPTKTNKMESIECWMRTKAVSKRLKNPKPITKKKALNQKQNNNDTTAKKISSSQSEKNSLCVVLFRFVPSVTRLTIAGVEIRLRRLKWNRKKVQFWQFQTVLFRTIKLFVWLGNWNIVFLFHTSQVQILFLTSSPRQGERELDA